MWGAILGALSGIGKGALTGIKTAGGGLLSGLKTVGKGAAGKLKTALDNEDLMNVLAAHKGDDTFSSILRGSAQGRLAGIEREKKEMPNQLPVLPSLMPETMKPLPPMQPMGDLTPELDGFDDPRRKRSAYDLLDF